MLKKKLPKHKNFDYQPRFYDPDKDEELKELERRKRRLGFRSQSRLKRHKRSPLLYFIILALLVYIYLKLSGQI
jgi:uncharacterized membrane protein (DUF106 family)